MYIFKQLNKKLKQHHLPNDALLWIGLLSFIIDAFASFFLILYLVFIIGFWLSLLVGLLFFYLFFIICIFLGSKFTEWFVNLYRK